MRLSLSSAAAPDAALAELLAACARRGLAAVELAEPLGHGLDAATNADDLEALRAASRDAGVEVCGIFRRELHAEDLEPAAQLAAALGAPLVVTATGVPWGLLPDAARVFAAAGAELLLATRTDPDAVDLLRRSIGELPVPGAVGIAWEVMPESDDPSLVGEVVHAAGPHLRYVRLHGGGPEAAQQTGRGVGALMARLTLTRFAGPLVLTPSTPRYHYVWRAWLGRAGGWGCGSKQSDPSLIALDKVNTEGGR